MSNINYININENFPIQGQDNPSQGFRDNFSVIKGSLQSAKHELEYVQLLLTDFVQNGLQETIHGNILIKGAVTTRSLLPTTNNTTGDLWLVIDENNSGYVYVNNDWLNVGSVKGPAGIQGTQGTQGTRGTQGTQGTQGRQGVQGIQGTQGTQGRQGIQGPQGIQGIQGTDGAYAAQGTQGTQGTIGIQGTDGAYAAQGIQGTQGLLGYQGTQGTQGIQGVQGTRGFQGILGTQGTQGIQGTQGTEGIQGTQGTIGISYNNSIIVNLGDLSTTNPSIQLTPLISNTRIYTVRLTGNNMDGIINITALGAEEYGECLLLLTSTADGTNKMSVNNSIPVKWISGNTVSLNPLLNETIGLYIQSISGNLYLSTSTWI